MATFPLPPSHPDHAILAPLAAALERHGGGPAGFAAGLPPLFRRAVDEVIDAPRTNRFTIGELEKTEKTYLGTKVEILLRDFLKLPKGRILDLLIDGVEVDIKNTMQRPGPSRWKAMVIRPCCCGSMNRPPCAIAAWSWSGPSI